MPLSIKHPDADRLARELARRQGRSLTDAVIHALEMELERERRRVRAVGVADALLAIAHRHAALPIVDDRSDDEILGFGPDGLPR